MSWSKGWLRGMKPPVRVVIGGRFVVFSGSATRRCGESDPGVFGSSAEPRVSSSTFNAELAMRGCASSQIVRREDGHHGTSKGNYLGVYSSAPINDAKHGVDHRPSSPRSPTT